jgi:antitoxin component YwqK of YwqJK toxin-antitoxin module
MYKMNSMLSPLLMDVPVALVLDENVLFKNSYNEIRTNKIQFETYHSNGSIRELLYFNEEGQLDGNIRVHYNNGNVAIDCTYINGKKQGMYFEYSKTGNILFSAIYDKDIMVSYIKF